MKTCALTILVCFALLIAVTAKPFKKTGSFIDASIAFAFGDERLYFNWDWDEGIIETDHYYGPPDHYRVEHFENGVLAFCEDNIPGLAESWSVPVNPSTAHRITVYAKRADGKTIDRFTIGPINL